ncbi:unnamed protein product [Paramecium sonneborni]|uniref:Uncharacterized protein n=1 Tax=Paramecium sonneborni TaxID=65129 RepID=A0A8S1M7M8_9CILI|nr:unnamed protein product [Paramecium sonneborni]
MKQYLIKQMEDKKKLKKKKNQIKNKLKFGNKIYKCIKHMRNKIQITQKMEI